MFMNSLVVDLAAGELLARLPHHGAGAGALALVPAVQHRSARQHDRGHVDGRRRHHAGRRGLVAAGGQHHAVEGIAEQEFDEAEIGKVAVERRSRAFAGFLDRMDRKFHRDAAGFADAFADALGEIEMMPVAGGEVVAGLRNADDRLAGLQFLAGQAVIEIALQIERGHPRIMRIVEPFEGSQFAALAVGCLVVPVGAFFHFVPPGSSSTRLARLRGLGVLPCAKSQPLQIGRRRSRSRPFEIRP